ncbi:hypothetical protein QAD02_000883 [Eretmocerus hayati]|uniref:Uncharacterized protein n=1 Tax=Eretmocerus hayati TaxID=131215 RepID=A0ACC2NEF9_9HYME|nr:hypothetical protein QAD02_000883 [Eretmocerus hayati]
MKEVNSWTDVVAFNVAKTHLKNAALKWYMNKVSPIKSNADLVTSFKSMVCSSMSEGDNLCVVLARVQEYKKLIPDYVLDKIWLCNGLETNRSEIRDEVAASLWSKDLANHIMRREFDSTYSILPEMMRFKRFYIVRQERVAGNKRQTSTNNAASFTSSRGNSNKSRGNSSSSTAVSGSSSSTFPANSSGVEAFHQSQLLNVQHREVLLLRTRMLRMCLA